MKALVLYARPGCCLCEEARDEIEALLEEGFAFELREVNIEEDERLHARHLERIPVVEVDGVIVSELRLDLDALRASLDTVRA